MKLYMRFTAKVQERRKHRKTGFRGETQQFLLIPTKFKLKKGQKVEVEINEQGTNGLSGTN